MVQSITITATQLRTLTDPVIPLAGRDDMLPVLTAVQFSSRGKYLTAMTTDRFRAGVARLAASPNDDGKAEWPAFDALIPVAAIRSILRTFAAGRRDNPELTLTADGSELRVELSGGLDNGLFGAGSVITYRLQDGQFPSVGALIQTAIDAEGSAEPTGYDMHFMADFRHVHPRRQALVVKSTSASKPSLVIGEDFIGVIMPRHYHGVTLDGSDWANLLQQPEPPAAKKRASRSKKAVA